MANVMTRRVSADVIGDDAVELGILELSLGIQQIAKSKSDKDSLLMKAAFASLSSTLEQYQVEHDVKYPDFADFMKWLTGKEVFTTYHENESGFHEEVDSDASSGETARVKPERQNFYKNESGDKMPSAQFTGEEGES